MIGKPLHNVLLNEKSSNFNKNLVWLKEALAEKLYRIKIQSSQVFRFHCSTEDNDHLLYIPLIPNYIIQRYPSIELSIENYGNIVLDLVKMKLGYLIPDNINLPNFGLCKVPKEVISDLRFHVNRQKHYINNTLVRFLSSLTSNTTKWRYHYLRGQFGNDNLLEESGLNLEIIEGEAGTGKSHSIIHSYDKYDGRVITIVYEDGFIPLL